MVHTFSRPTRGIMYIGRLAGGFTLAVLAGCASVPPPDASMNQAQAAMAAHKYAEAADLADEARADAELARVRASLGNARAQIQAKADENARLREQVEQAPAEAGSAPAEGGSAPATLEDMPVPPASVLSAPVPQDEGGLQPALAGSTQQPNPTQDQSHQP